MASLLVLNKDPVPLEKIATCECKVLQICQIIKNNSFPVRSALPVLSTLTNAMIAEAKYDSCSFLVCCPKIYRTNWKILKIRSVIALHSLVAVIS